MPNLKIFADETIGTEAMDRLHAALPALRDLMCDRLDVALPFAQFVLVSVRGLDDQALLAVEIQVLPKPERTREHLLASCAALREALRTVIDVKTAVRVTTVDPANYLVVR